MSVKKIAYVGTSCVGKSTLLEPSRSLATHVLLVKEAARDYFAAHPAVTDRFSVQAQGAIQDLALEREKDAQVAAVPLYGNVAIVCDRSVLDAPVYVLADGDPQGSERLFEKVVAWLPTYQRIYLLDPSDVPYQLDGIRDEAEEIRTRFHEAFIEFFSAHSIPYTLLSGTVEQRLATVRAQLEGRTLT